MTTSHLAHTHLNPSEDTVNELLSTQNFINEIFLTECPECGTIVQLRCDKCCLCDSCYEALQIKKGMCLL